MIFKGFVLYIRLTHIQSLKEKRSVIKPLLSDLKRLYNASVIECGNQNKLDHIEIGLAIASLSNMDLENTLNKIINTVEIDHNLIIYTIEEQ